MVRTPTSSRICVREWFFSPDSNEQNAISLFVRSRNRVEAARCYSYICHAASTAEGVGTNSG